MTAFGPAGLAAATTRRSRRWRSAATRAAPWLSQWYATALFGALKTGTGLLIDMGRTVTVSSVRVSLVATPGAGLQLRAGTKPVPAWLPRWRPPRTRAAPCGCGPASPVHVRYLLIWFTKLPPDNAGTYQASVYRITVQGQPLTAGSACDLPSWHER